MERNRAMIASVTLMLLQVGYATAQSDAPGKYPAPRCRQPLFQALPQAQDARAPDQAQASLNDYQVRQYNREVEAYDACMHNYIAKANRDALRIRAQANKDVKRITDNANASIAMIRAQVRQATVKAKKLSNIPASTLAGK